MSNIHHYIKVDGFTPNFTTILNFSESIRGATATVFKLVLGFTEDGITINCCLSQSVEKNNLEEEIIDDFKVIKSKLSVTDFQNELGEILHYPTIQEGIVTDFEDGQKMLYEIYEIK